MDLHSAEQHANLSRFLLSRREALERHAGEEWSSAGPKSVAPYVPCASARVGALLHAARLSEEDVVYDLGCGDGRVLHAAAAQHGCTCVGLDIDADCIAEASGRAAEQGLSSRCSFAACDLLALTTGALRCGDLGDALAPAERGRRFPPPTAVLIFLTGHGLSRLAPLLHREWEAGPALRLLTCVEALDDVFDYEEGDLFGGGSEGAGAGGL